MVITKTALIPASKRRISASSMNTWYKCPRLYYYKYVLFLPEAQTIAMIKGSIVHSILQIFYETFEEDMNGRMQKLLDIHFVIPEGLVITEEEKKKAYDDVKAILELHLHTITLKFQALRTGEKTENLRHAFYLTRPKFREKKIENKEYNLVGIIDTLTTDYEGNIIIGDYKTGSTYGLFLNEEIRRQLAFYALLYYLDEGKYPNVTVTHFLRYGIQDRIEVTPHTIDFITKEVNNFIINTQGDLIIEYPKKECKFCNHPNYPCAFFDICSGVKSLADDHQKKLQDIFNIDLVPKEEVKIDEGIIDVENEKTLL